MSREPSKPEMTFGEAQGVTGLLACMDEVRTYRLRCWCWTEISGIRQIETARVAHKDGWRRMGGRCVRSMRAWERRS